MRKIFIVLPIYNEAEVLPQLLEKIGAAAKGLDEEVAIVAVDDGSRDDSPGIISRAARDFDIVCVTHGRNRGLRQTMQDGYQKAAELAADDDLIVTLDADDTQDPRYIGRMIEKLDSGYDVVIASRYQKGAVVKGVPPHRRLFSLGAILLCRLFLRLDGVRDYACGFRLFRASLIKDCVAYYGDDFLGIRGYGFICAVETIVKAGERGARFAEIPFDLRYDLKGGESKMNVGRTVMGYFLLIWRQRRGARRR